MRYYFERTYFRKRRGLLRLRLPRSQLHHKNLQIHHTNIRLYRTIIRLRHADKLQECTKVCLGHTKTWMFHTHYILHQANKPPPEWSGSSSSGAQAGHSVNPKADDFLLSFQAYGRVPFLCA